MSSTIRLILRIQARRHSTAARRDFFGIADVTTKDVAGIVCESRLPEDKFQARYKALKVIRNLPENREIESDKVYGTLRYDSQNKPKSHGQYEPKNEKLQYSTTKVAQMYVKDDEALGAKPDKTLAPLDRGDQKGFGDGIVVSQVQPDQDLKDVLENFKDLASETKSIGRYSNQPPATFLFRYGQQTASCEPEAPEVYIDHSGHLDQGETKLSGVKLNRISTSVVNVDVPVAKAREMLTQEPSMDRVKDVKSQDIVVNEKIIKPPKKTQKVNAGKYLNKIVKDEAKPLTKQLSIQLESNKSHPMKPMIKLDSMGFRNYTYQVPSWYSVRHTDVLQAVKDSIIYNNYDIIAVNKPYGIASHEKQRERELIDMNSLMHELADELKVKKLYLAHRLDKTTTGVLLFATSQEKARELNRLFKSDQITKKYLCIVRGNPGQEHAVIDIPLATYRVAGKSRACLAPESHEAKAQLSKKYLEARRAITEYKVIHSNAKCSLLEIRPRSGVKHQIRCHLGFGINCPILGDHKYSHLDKLAPQVLPQPALNKLRLRQAKVRTLPVHLHARSITIPGAKANGQTLHIMAPLPAHFSQNMEALGLKLVQPNL